MNNTERPENGLGGLRSEASGSENIKRAKFKLPRPRRALDLIIGVQDIVRTHSQLKDWTLTSDLPKGAFTIKNDHIKTASCSGKATGREVELIATRKGAGIIPLITSHLLDMGLAHDVVEVEHHDLSVTAGQKVDIKSNPTARFKTNLDAVKEAATEFAEILTVHDNALKVAANSDFEDPDFTYAALMALADIALREREFGIKDTRQAYLAKQGFAYVSGSSNCTLNKHRKDYTVIHNGNPVIIAGHISKGVKARRLLRIYFAWLPESKSFLIGHVGEHLPTETHSH